LYISLNQSRLLITIVHPIMSNTRSTLPSTPVPIQRHIQRIVNNAFLDIPPPPLNGGDEIDFWQEIVDHIVILNQNTHN
jgi:hypothetical protein